MVALQNEILSRPKVRKILAAQHDDGWIGNELHGVHVQGLDSSVSRDKQRCRKGLAAYEERRSGPLADEHKTSHRTTFRVGMHWIRGRGETRP